MSDFWQNAKTLVFAFCRKSDKIPPGAGSSYPVTNSAPSRARSETNIPVGPDSSGGPPEPSETVGMFAAARLSEGAI